MAPAASPPALDIGYFTDQGPYRKRNEDVAHCDRENGLLIVADGLGGAAAGDRAARVATDLMCFALINQLTPGAALDQALPDSEVRTALRERFSAGFSIDDAHERLRFAFTVAHFGVLAEASRSGSVGMATAMVTAWLQDGIFHIGHVGDCRAYTLAAEGLHLHTRDHSLSAMLAGRMALPKGAEDSPFLRSRLTQVVGGEVNPAPDICQWKPEPETRLLLCSDGVWGGLDDEEVARTLGLNTSAEAISRAFVESAIAAGSKDNSTALVAIF